MTRIDELQKKYPDLPGDVIVQREIIKSGVRDTEDLDKVSHWTRGTVSYQSYDFDVSLKQAMERRAGKEKQGYTLRPGALHTKSGVGVALRRNNASPYTVREIGDGQFALYEGEENVDADVYFIRSRTLPSDDAVTSRGTPVPSLVERSRVCFSVGVVRHCEHFNHGEQCKFCNYEGTQLDSRALGVYRPPAVNPEEVVEAYKIRSSEQRLVEGRLVSGGFSSSEKEANVYLRFVEKLASAASYTPNLTLHGEPVNRKDLQRLKDAGLGSFTVQMEVWDERLFAETCPGKAKYKGHEGHKQACLDAVDVFGAGNVGCMFVGGLTLIPENGFRTWQAARDSHIEGNTWMIKNGIMPSFTALRLPPGSVYGADPDNRLKAPPTEYYLDIVMAHKATMFEYGLYQKLNRLMYCGFDCAQGNIFAGEPGIIALAGDLGNWMAEAVPAEANWLAKFVSSVKSTVKGQ